MSDNLEEAGIGSVIGTAAKNAASRVGNNFLKKIAGKNDLFGAGSKAQGNLDVLDRVKQLKNEFQRYLAQQNIPMTMGSLRQFMQDIHGAPIPSYQAPAASDQGEASGSRATGPKIKAKQQAQGQQNPGKAQAHLVQYQNKAMSQIIRRLKDSDWPDFRKTEVLPLVKELIMHARDHGGPEKDRVVMFLNTLKKNRDWVSRVPEIANMKVESRLLDRAHIIFEGIVGMAIEIVENDVRTKQALTESYERFLIEAIEREFYQIPDDEDIRGAELDRVLTKIIRMAFRGPDNFNNQSNQTQSKQQAQPQSAPQPQQPQQQQAQPQQQPQANTGGGKIDKQAVNANLSQLGVSNQDIERIMQQIEGRDLRASLSVIQSAADQEVAAKLLVAVLKTLEQ